MEFPVGYVNLEDRACPELRKHRGCQTGRADSSHCSSRGILNKRGEFLKSKHARHSGVLLYNRKSSLAAAVNGTTCTRFLSSGADTPARLRLWSLLPFNPNEPLPKWNRKPGSNASRQSHHEHILVYLTQFS